MKKRDDIKLIVAAALMIYSAYAALSAQEKLCAAEALRDGLSEYAGVLAAERDALCETVSLGLTDELAEKLARERLGLIRQGEIIFYFTGEG